MGASPSEKITYTYDADNELTGADDAYATLTFTYDSGGNELTSATSGPGTGQPSVTLTSTYNPQNNLASVTDNVSGNVGITTYLYDAGQRLTTITTSYNGTTGPELVTTYRRIIKSLHSRVRSAAAAPRLIRHLVMTLLTGRRQSRIMSLVDRRSRRTFTAMIMLTE